MDRTLKNKLRPHDLDPLLGFQPWQVHHHPGVQGLQLKLHFLVFQAVVTILPHSLGTRIEILKSLRIGFVFCMLQHLIPEKLCKLLMDGTNNHIPGNVSWVSGDEELLNSQPIGHVIILSTPAPKHVRETIDKLR